MTASATGWPGAFCSYSVCTVGPALEHARSWGVSSGHPDGSEAKGGRFKELQLVQAPQDAFCPALAAVGQPRGAA